MSKTLTFTIIPQDNNRETLGFNLSPWYYEEETFNDTTYAAQVVKKVRDSYKNIDVRLHIPTKKVTFDPEEVLKICKLANENGIKASVSVDFSQLDILRAFAHLISQVEIPVDSLAHEISSDDLQRKIESLRQINKDLAIKFRTVVGHDNYTEMMADKIQEFENSQWEILRCDDNGMQRTSDFKFFSFLRNNAMDTNIAVQIKDSTREPCLIASSRGRIMQAQNIEGFSSRELTEIAMDELPQWFESSPENDVYDSETSQLISSMKKLFGLFTEEDAADEIWENSVNEGLNLIP